MSGQYIRLHAGFRLARGLMIPVSIPPPAPRLPVVSGGSGQCSCGSWSCLMAGPFGSWRPSEHNEATRPGRTRRRCSRSSAASVSRHGALSREYKFPRRGARTSSPVDSSSSLARSRIACRGRGLGGRHAPSRRRNAVPCCPRFRQRHFDQHTMGVVAVDLIMVFLFLAAKLRERTRVSPLRSPLTPALATR